MSPPPPPPMTGDKGQGDCAPHDNTSPKAKARGSFSSVREDDPDRAQAIAISKVSAYTHQLQLGLTSDDSKLPSMGDFVLQPDLEPLFAHFDHRQGGHWNPPAVKEWKGVKVQGRAASRSFSDTSPLSQGWKPHSLAAPATRVPIGGAPLEMLPLELQTEIIDYLVINTPTNAETKRNQDLMSLLLTSKTLSAATQPTLYRQVTIPHSRIYKKFLCQIASYTHLGAMVRRLDFSHFNSNFMFATASERDQAQNLTAATLLQGLTLMRNLQEFLAQEHIDGDIDQLVLRKLFFGLEFIKALDFCGCSSPAFRAAFVGAIPSVDAWDKGDLALERLSLHKCTTLPGSVFTSLMPHLPHITHLDVAGTRMSNAALLSIPATANITHLNLAKCTMLSADAIIEFLAHHPAVKNSILVWLSLSVDASTHETFDEDAVTRLLPLLPKSLKSLSLKGSKMNATHLPLLLPLTKHLEELALGRGLSLADINALVVTPPITAARSPSDPLLNLTPMNIDSPEPTWETHTLRFLDLSDLWGADFPLGDVYDTRHCPLLTSATAPLEVIEVRAEIGHLAQAAPGNLAACGWSTEPPTSRKAGHRVWLVRGAAAAGERPWKMGARSWGMRKVPVAWAEVGGMYGHYMLARKL